jgi:hypothetical protein
VAADTAITPSYPVTFDVQRQLTGRNRLTVGFRFILAIPQVLLVGVPGPGFGVGWWGFGQTFLIGGGGGSGVMGFVAGIMSFISWFAIVFTGRQPRGLWDFNRFFLRWRASAIAYTAILRDEYPPFGSDLESYPVSFDVPDFPEKRDRWSVGLRLIFAIPHLFLLVFLSVAWAVTALISWFAILITGRYPAGLYDFAVGYLRWSLRVQAYVLLMLDDYPPFSLQ